MTADLAANKRPPGTVPHPVTIYPTSNNRRPTGVKPNGKPIDWSKIKPGKSFPSASAPAVAEKPFTLRCTLTGPKPHGVILAHGGSAVGYVLYAKEGKLVFAIRHTGTRIQRVSVQAPEGPFTITASLTTAHLALKINDRGMTAKAVNLLTRHPQENLDIGHDSKNPVDPEAPNSPINGKLTNLSVTLDQSK